MLLTSKGQEVNSFAQKHFDEYTRFNKEAQEALEGGFLPRYHKLMDKATNAYELYMDYMINPPRNLNKEY